MADHLDEATLLADESQAGPERPANAGLYSSLAAAATGLSACGGSGQSGAGAGGIVSSGGQTSTPAITQAQAARFLLQAQFSASDSDINAVINQGYTAWLSAQFALPGTQTGASWLDSRGYNAMDSNLYFFNSTLGDNMAWNQLIASSDPVRKRLTLALSEMMVVSLEGLANEGWPAYLAAWYWDVLAGNVFGNFRTLLEAVTLNLGMGYYLNTKGNLKENAAGRQPDENYAREVMQLFTIGLYMLNEDGTVQTDASGNKLYTYSQSDITNLAHVFTGYDTDYADENQTTVTVATTGKTYKVYEPSYTGRPMINNATNHSSLAVTFLGTTIPANTDAATALKTALDALFNHQNVGPFFARQMIQHLVTSNPSSAYVKRVADVFANNGAGVRGDLKAVWTAILTDAEALTPGTSATAGKVREPIVRLVQLMRTFNATTATGAWSIGNLSDAATGMGQSPLRSPSVFNFFRPGYVPPNTAIGDAGLTAPEFQIVNEVSVAGYINYLAAVLANGINDVKLDLSALLPLAGDSQGLIDWLNLHLAANQVGTATQAKIKTALDAQTITAASTTAQKTAVVQLAIYLMMSAPEYLIQK